MKIIYIANNKEFNNIKDAKKEFSNITLLYKTSEGLLLNSLREAKKRQLFENIFNLFIATQEIKKEKRVQKFYAELCELFLESEE